MRFLSLLLFATTATVVPAQNLPAWSKWMQINPGYQRIYSATPSRITFNPYCPLTKCGNPVRTGITQTMRVPKAGLYQFRFEGWGGGTGYFPADFTIHTRERTVSAANWHVAETLALPTGDVNVRIMTQTSDFKVDVWNCVPPLSATSFGSRSWF